MQTSKAAARVASRTGYEPPLLEVVITLTVGLTVLSPYYRDYAKKLDLRGDERVLDFGSGSGVLSRHIARHLERGGGHIDCVDISRRWQDAIRYTLRRFQNVDYYLGHLTELALSEHAYGLVISHFVLHEVPEARRPIVMQALARRLRPDGRIVLREPQGEGLTPEELGELARAAGLSITRLAVSKIAIGSVCDATLTRNA